MIKPPNGVSQWWHSLPTPDGSRIEGMNQDKELQSKLWNALKIERGSLAGKAVLDIGANDGYFTVAASLSGAASVTAINSADWPTFPQNIEFSCDLWNVEAEIITADFRSYEFGQKFDVILFLGVLYHLENVFDCIRDLRKLLNPGGSIYIETQMAKSTSDLPIFEYASDIYPTSAIAGKSSTGKVGISNYLFPNVPAILNLANCYDFKCTDIGEGSVYVKENPYRSVFLFSI
ncbi:MULTISPECIES: class I SAM-dependent methyltransferase [Rhodopseudomonas]|uniref:class I SAM-dependent methyltransferase n=1 Tax=Rhodopseudomonas TaxID=1073 RepID=UPI00128D3BED|nr:MULTISPECIES: class I SAM-dependent methyltransferase [Rhodopseudomonas]MDF3813997.1 class I SAM-dependent methyltransferase [Rhodopseudomonas sp. BAL398]WOK19957.1 class I SAM-dependent methyltransferase [Rhodopseudomonas sp. BAL398]